MKMTPVRRNITRILKQCIDRAYARHVARCRKLSMHKSRTWQDADTAKEIDNFFTYMGGLPPLPTISGIPDENTRNLLNVLVRLCYVNDKARKAFEKDLLADLRTNAAQYELLSQMPEPRREYTRREPRTLVERRADAVDKKVREWERKLKLAKTKLATYRKKQKYYTQKKGSVV